MKKIFVVLVVMLTTVSVFAQNKDWKDMSIEERRKELNVPNPNEEALEHSKTQAEYWGWERMQEQRKWEEEVRAEQQRLLKEQQRVEGEQRRLQVEKWRKEMAEKAKAEKQAAELRAAAIAKQPKKVQDSINKKEVFIGMTKEQVLLSWGKPEHINRTVGQWESMSNGFMEVAPTFILKIAS